MTTKGRFPAVEPILEDEEGSDREVQSSQSTSNHLCQHRSTMKSASAPAKDRERPRKHRSAGNKHMKSSRRKARESSSVESRCRSSSEEDGEGEPVQEYRDALAAARARLTSPSTISSFTAQTTATNKSSSSSGSNSTITQASITKRMLSGEKCGSAEASELPLSPAVPDPPNVFAFLEKDDEDEPGESHHKAQWSPSQIDATFLATPLASPKHPSPSSSSSSASSTFRSEDNFSERAAEIDTDRSSSPERFSGEQDSPHIQPPQLMDRASFKVAAQLAAAHHRQNAHGLQNFGTPDMPRGNVNLPHVPSSSLSSRYQHHARQVLPRAEKLPVTGYELLASRLASFSSNNGKEEVRIKPIYRKFEALNHRLLLHIQDELAELEEQLHRVDLADTQYRRTNQNIVPASRRAAAQAGGELQWHKTDILGRIGYKLNQYNQALASFHSTQSLTAPAPTEIDEYRSYLQREHPIAESETRFLDSADDLISLYSERDSPSTQSESSYTFSSVASTSVLSQSSQASSLLSSSPEPVLAKESKVNNDVPASASPAFATAIALSVIVPVLTFNVIPGFLGRMTVFILVACFNLWALIQSGSICQGAIVTREGLTCAGIYGGVMFVIAGTMA